MKIKHLTNLILVAMFVFGATTFTIADIDTSANDDIQLLVGELETLNVFKLTRLSITNPSVADAVKATDDSILMIAKAVGQTTLFVWDQEGKRAITVRVVKQDLSETKMRIEKLLKTADIRSLGIAIDKVERKVVIDGVLPENKEAAYKKIIKSYGGDVLDLVEVEEINDLIQIDMQITEVSETLAKTLGIDWNTETITYTEDLPVFDGSISDFFKIGEFARSAPTLSATLSALVSEGKARVLSKPKLVVLSGESANVQVGGEVPITTVTQSDIGQTESVEFKSFGVQMRIQPTITSEDRNKIDIDLSVNISDVDLATLETVSGDVAFSTTNANTKLLLDDNQTIVLAGLIRSLTSKSIDKVPFLADIPVVGALFRKTSSPAEEESEVVIVLTPTILRQKSKDEPKMASDVFDESLASPRVARPVKSKPYYSGMPSEMKSYIQQVQEKITRSVVYPREAEMSGWEGTVKVGMLILDDGTLAYAMVKESSGYDVIDDYALKTAKASAPYTGFPAETSLRELNVTIPIVYSLR